MAPSDNSEPGFLAESAPAYGSGWGEAAAHGIDLSLIEDSLRLTPWQRLVENDRALALVRMLEQARIHKDGTADSNS